MTVSSRNRLKEDLEDDGLSITVIVATKNEEANIESCLKSLTKAHRVLVVDSCSTDRTQTLAMDGGAEVVNYRYHGGYPKKRQWAMDNLQIDTLWTMLIDADEQVTAPLWIEIERAIKSKSADAAFMVKKGFHFMGKRFRFGGFSHAAIVLFRTGAARFEEAAGNSANEQDMEVHERLLVNGGIGHFHHHLIHDDCKGLASYIDRHNKYSSWEAGIRAYYMKTGSWGERTIRASAFGDSQSFRRFIKPLALKVPCEAWLWFFYHYLICGAMFEGRRGLIASSLRKAYIGQVRAKMFELELCERTSGSAQEDPRGSETIGSERSAGPQT